MKPFDVGQIVIGNLCGKVEEDRNLYMLVMKDGRLRKWGREVFNTFIAGGCPNLPRQLSHGGNGGIDHLYTPLVFLPMFPLKWCWLASRIWVGYRKVKIHKVYIYFWATWTTYVKYCTFINMCANLALKKISIMYIKKCCWKDSKNGLLVTEMFCYVTLLVTDFCYGLLVTEM